MRKKVKQELSSQSIHDRKARRAPKEPHELSEDELQELRDTFSLMDVDGDGSITKDEIHHILLTTGFGMTSEQMDEIMVEIDKEGVGALSFDNFAKMMLGYINLSNPEDELRLVFHTFDKDGDGSISMTEFMNVMNKVGMRMTQEETIALISSVDSNGDGELSFDEFHQLMTTNLE